MSEQVTQAAPEATVSCTANVPVTMTGTASETTTMAQPPRRSKVAIIGFADSWPMAPFSHPEWDVHCLNQFYDLTGGLVGGRINYTDLAKEKRLRWYDLHARHDLETDPNVISRHPQHLQKLRDIGKMGAPVVMQRAWPDVPNSVEYPLAQMTDIFGRYWTNSISYMIALSIAEGATEIGLYGVNMAQDCLAPEMRVLTADLRWVRAGDLQVGQELLAFDEHARLGIRRYQTTTVKSLSAITRPCERVQMADGSSLVASVGHYWLTYRNQGARWQRTDGLMPEDCLGTVQVASPGQPLECAATAITGKEPMGEQGVVGITTGTRTLIVEGFASHNSEYALQRPSCEYFIGWARARGIVVHIPAQSDLLCCPYIYGYEDEKVDKFTAKLDQLLKEQQERMTGYARQRDEAAAYHEQFNGACQQLQAVRRLWNIGR